MGGQLKFVAVPADQILGFEFVYVGISTHADD